MVGKVEDVGNWRVIVGWVVGGCGTCRKKAGGEGCPGWKGFPPFFVEEELSAANGCSEILQRMKLHPGPASNLVADGGASADAASRAQRRHGRRATLEMLTKLCNTGLVASSWLIQLRGVAYFSTCISLPNTCSSRQ